MRRLAWVFWLGGSVALAQGLPVGGGGESRLVVFPFDPNESYTLLARPGALTDIQLAEDEHLEVLAMGDTAQWTVAQATGHVFLKPLRTGIFTSATLVTDRRTYQMTLHAGAESGKWYQRVSWSYPPGNVIRLQRPAAPEAGPDARAAVRVGAGESGGFPESLHFGYVLEGRADFRPNQVFDDGRFIYLRLPQGLQELPSVFVLGEEGTPELVNYLVRGEFLVVQRLAARLLLKLGRAEVRVLREGRGASPTAGNSRG